MQKLKYEYTCSNCGEKKIIDIYPVINLQSDKELYNDLFSLDLFRINCENCNTVSMIQYDTLIVDMYKKYMVYLFLSDSIDKFNIYIKEFINNFKSNSEQLNIWNSLKNTRVTTSLNEMLEKLLIFDYDLDDRIIELLKRGLYEKNRLDEDLYESIRFNKIEKEQLSFTCFNSKDDSIQPIEIAVDIKYYNILVDYAGGLTKIKCDDFALINKMWAKKQIEEN